VCVIATVTLQLLLTFHPLLVPAVAIYAFTFVVSFGTWKMEQGRKSSKSSVNEADAYPYGASESTSLIGGGGNNMALQSVRLEEESDI